MAEFEGIHPDEGTIHAWLDDALDAASASRVEAHVSECESCAERVAEARGLIAGASRVVGLLDDRPVALIRPAAPATSGDDFSVWRLLRVTPARAAIAAILLVVAGITLTRDRIAMDSSAGPVADRAAVAITEQAEPVEQAAASPTMAPPGAAATDSLLASAVARRVAQDQPARGMGATPGTAIPTMPLPSAANVPTMNSAPAREVARGRMEAQLSEVVVTGARADKSAAKTQVAQVAGAGCYRIASTDSAAATWGGLVLPAEIELTSTGAVSDAGGMRYAITPVRGGDAIGSWSRAGGDAVSLTLRGATATTVGVMSPSGRTLSGTLSAHSATSAGAAAAAPPASDARMARAVRVDSNRAAGIGAARSVRVVASRIDCP